MFYMEKLDKDRYCIFEPKECKFFGIKTGNFYKEYQEHPVFYGDDHEGREISVYRKDTAKKLLKELNK